MSKWTRINATIVADFGNQTRYWIEHFFNTKMNDKHYSIFYEPKNKGDGCEITGSEINATVLYAPKRDFEKDPRNRYFHDNEWVITINGALRDRTIEDTIAEWRRFGWKFGMFLRECKRFDGESPFDNTIVFARLIYWNVDIEGQGKHYHRCSIKDRKESAR